MILNDDIKKNRYMEMDEKFTSFFLPTRKKEKIEKNENQSGDPITSFLNDIPVEKFIDQIEQIMQTYNQLKPYIKSIPNIINKLKK